MRRLLILFLVFHVGSLLANPESEYYSATLPNGSVWIGQKSAQMPAGARKLSGTGNGGFLEVVPIIKESNYDKATRKIGPLRSINRNGSVILTGHCVGNMPNTYVREKPQEQPTANYPRSRSNTEDIVSRILSSDEDSQFVEEAKQGTNSNPNDPKAWSHLGDVLKNHREEAISAYKKAVSLDPSFSRAYVRIATLNRLSGNYSEALGNLNKAESLMQSQSSASWESQDLYYQFSEVYEKMGNQTMAAEARRKAGL